MTEPRTRSRLPLVAWLIAAVALGGCESAGRSAFAAPATAPGTTPETSDATPSTGFGSYLAGRFAQQQRDYGAAAAFFARALADDPADFELMSRTLLLDVSEGRFGDALPLARKIIEIDRTMALANLVLVIDRIKAGEYAAADLRGAGLPTEGLHRFISPLVKAWIKAGVGDTDAAIAALEPVGAIRGLGPLRDFHAGLIADLADRTELAEADYKKVVGTTTKANWRSVEMLANLYERTGRAGEAVALYDRFDADNADSDYTGVGRARVAAGQKPDRRARNAIDGTAEAFFDLATVLNQGETTDLALIYGRMSLELRPDFPLAQLLVSDVLEVLRRPEAALLVARSVDPQSPFGWTARLRATSFLDQLGRMDEAVADLNQMAAERPNRALPLNQLGDLYRGKSRYAEAITAYDAAEKRLRPGETLAWTFFYSRGIALERGGDWGRAQSDLKRALELQPDQPYVLNYLGYSWVDRHENLEEALRLIERAVQLRPTDGSIVDSLGWAHYRLGNYPRAVLYLERAAELRPQDSTINDHLGDVYWRMGRQNEARAQWRRALLFGPEPAEIKLIDAKLEHGLTTPPTKNGG